jgi:hypothetical protein
MMGDIYARASSIILWLGSTDADVEGLKAWLKKSRGAKPDKDCILTMTTLRRLDYWDRLWIIREIYLARDIVFLWDRHRLREEWIRTIFVEGGEQFPAGMRMRCVFKRWHSAQHVTTSQAIKVVRDSRCSDPRDMVYGLRAILPLGRLIVGYEKSVEEVYLDGVQAMINNGGHLNSLLEVIFFLGQAMLPRKFGEDRIVLDDIY